MTRAREDDWRLRQPLCGEKLCQGSAVGSRNFALEGQQISILGGHTVSPELAQVAAILERLIEHQESKILALLVLQKPVRLPLEDRVHGEMPPMREY